MKNKIYGWSKEHYETRLKRKEELKNNRKTLILTLLLLSVISSGIYFGKLHRTRECVVTNVSHDRLVVTVQHPNGWTYDYYADCTENITEGETIKVIFNELTDWEKNYSVINIIE